ncbi:hypothetical protein FHR75_002616 [Kineococcus radiotolerans]|uniref:Uncharacterized protein n=1 Tax=Kineococcus radiotolerans TaxID=131568 RepID=A0A7W4XX68_KINRA|nr:hypothetical protein [Kineococcus radiotolerans]MBB2901801.1 hypothetical protein [Kineococcus radiotolerans]
MPLRHDREDTTAQEAALREARDAAATVLAELAAEAKSLAKAYGARSVRIPDGAALAGLVDAARRAEEAVDIAAHDLATARGEDG